MLQIVLVVLVVMSLGYWLVVWASAWKFFHRRPALPLDGNVPSSGHRHPVSILKPVKGLDSHAYDNFASFCRQDYGGGVEVVFGVNDAADPAVRAIKKLQADFPHVPIKLVVVPPGALNAKVGILERLAREAAHDVLVIADADIRVGPGYLSEVVTPLANPRVGLVTCLYRGVGAENLAARLEALYINSVFLPEAILGTRFPGARFAFGSTLALRRGDLERIGGFHAIDEYLADDYQLAVRIAALGLDVRLSGYVVGNVLGNGRLKDYWQRQVRWARTIRASRPREYPGLLITYTTGLALILAAIAGWPAWSLGLLLAAVVLRWVLAWQMAVLAQARVRLRNLIWLPLADLATAAVWAAGAVGNTICWRGRTLRLLADGRLALLPQSPGAAPAWFAAAVRGLDRWLRRRQGIEAFSPDSRCLLRLAVTPSPRELDLADGTHVEAGQRIGELHFWNEHIPPMPLGGPNLAWARSLETGFRRSLTELAEAAAEQPRMRDIEAFRAELAAVDRGGFCRLLRGLRSMGFESLEPDEARWQERFVRFWQNVYLWALMRVFNPGALRAGWLRRGRLEIWISRQALLGKYGARRAAFSAGG